MNGLDSLSLQLWRCTGSSGYWGLISFVSDCYFQPPSNPSLSCSLSTMTFPFLSLIVWSTIICPLLDKWPEYYEGANLCGIYNAVGGGNDLHCHQSKSSLFLSTYKAFIIHIVDQIREKKWKYCPAVLQSKVQLWVKQYIWQCKQWSRAQLYPGPQDLGIFFLTDKTALSW